MQQILVAGILGWLAIVPPAAAQFVGTLAFQPKDCDVNDGICTLVHDFGFIDPNGHGWQAAAGLETDGATIPSWAQPIIGGQFSEGFVKAAVIHDHYCIRHVRSFMETHRMFYDALVASGVDPVKANAMYYSVLIGGPKWVKLISGEPCKVGQFCIRNVGGSLSIADGKLVRGEGGDRYAWRDAIYSRPDVQAEMRDGSRIIEQQSIRDPSEALKLAKARRPGDEFLNAGAAVVYETIPASASREIILNYSDPHGADLALALAPHVEQLPDWMRKIGAFETGNRHEDVVVVLRGGGAKGTVKKYTLSTPRLAPEAQSGQGFKINSAIGQSIELQSRAEKLDHFKNCGEQSQASPECKISDPARQIVLLLTRVPANEGLKTLIKDNQLAFDTQSAKRVIVNLDEQDDIEYVDFVGLLHEQEEALASPDATPVTVLRVYKDAQYKIVRREQDAPVNLRDVKFGFEELR